MKENYTEKERKEFMRKYELSQMVTAQDKHQTILTMNGIAPNPNNFAKEFFRDRCKGKLLICPFCFTTNYLQSFIYGKGYYKCRECGVRVTQKTLEHILDIFNSGETIDVKEFAKWVYSYRFNGFFDKICLDVKSMQRDAKFRAWNDRLYKFGISQDFWGYYKMLKGEGITEKQEKNEE